MIVKNINGTTQRMCNCGNLLQHWKNFSKQIANECTALGCTKKDTEGVHVQINASYDNNWYIIPLCHKHSKSKIPLAIENGTKLVPANIRETCGEIKDIKKITDVA